LVPLARTDADLNSPDQDHNHVSVVDAPGMKYGFGPVFGKALPNCGHAGSKSPHHIVARFGRHVVTVPFWNGIGDMSVASIVGNYMRK
jgi:hypothetical protein